MLSQPQVNILRQLNQFKDSRLYLGQQGHMRVPSMLLLNQREGQFLERVEHHPRRWFCRRSCGVAWRHAGQLRSFLAQCSPDLTIYRYSQTLVIVEYELYISRIENVWKFFVRSRRGQNLGR